MATSQNGYKANDSSLIAKYTIVRDVTINLRKGDVSVVLLHFARWYDANIEHLTAADTGGYNPRVISGSTTLSNHASGTAEDLRWQKHPLGAVGTFTPSQRARIEAQLGYYEGVIRWGGNYSGRRDEMHYEINKPPADVARVAAKIRIDSIPPRVPTMQTISVKVPLLREGDDDSKLDGYNLIGRIQAIVGAERDGVWGAKTTQAIAKWTALPAAQCKALGEQVYRRVFGAA